LPPPAGNLALINMRQKTNGGPAEARNAGARVASGDVLVFLDADVAVHADTLEKIALRLGERPHLDAIFGAYDDRPAAPGTVSRFRNLLHHYFHLRSDGQALGMMARLSTPRADWSQTRAFCLPTDANNRAHDVENLYVVDGSFFPTSGGVNPALTIIANALRVADHVHREGW